jgi:hypothetical protein
MVAHAAMLNGWDFRIYSRKVKSSLYGAQYLHQPIPELDCGFPHTVRYTLRGTAEQYRRKVYGDEWDGTVSPEDFIESHSAWDIREAYDHLWREYHGEIQHFEIFASGPTSETAILAASVVRKRHDLVISTVPRKLWAEPGDVFESTKVWALGDTEMPRVEPAYRPEEFTVLCEGDPKVPWYRVSNIFGYCTIEWPWHTRDGVLGGTPHPGASIVDKPLRHSSRGSSDFIHLGRFGAWRKGYLSHEAFFEAMKVFADDAIK